MILKNPEIPGIQPTYGQNDREFKKQNVNPVTDTLFKFQHL